MKTEEEIKGLLEQVELLLKNVNKTRVSNGMSYKGIQEHILEEKINTLKWIINE